MSRLLEVCSPYNLAWKNGFVTGYHYKKENGEISTVFDYSIPFSKEEENLFCTRYNIPPDQRIHFYESLLKCIQREISVSNHLKEAGINSILTFSKADQAKDDKKVSHVLLETEQQVWPMVEKLFRDSISAISVIDVILRLSIVMRDIGRDPVSVVHRGLNLNDVYINSQEKILMGGFYYSAFPGGEVSDTPYLPCAPANLSESFLKGEPGSQSEDIKMLAKAAWNIFSGNPHDSQLSMDRLVKPEYAPEELTDILLSGINGLSDDTQCNAFRRNLLSCRKTLNKTDYAKTMIPVHTQPIKAVRIDIM